MKSPDWGAQSVETVHDVHDSHGLRISVFHIVNTHAQNLFQSSFDDSPHVLVNSGRNSLDTATSSEASDSRSCDSSNVFTQDLSMPRGPRRELAAHTARPRQRLTRHTSFNVGRLPCSTSTWNTGCHLVNHCDGDGLLCVCVVVAALMTVTYKMPKYQISVW